MRMQRIIQAIYPSQCVACEAQTDGDGGLCSDCWQTAAFIQGVVCDTCGCSLPGDDPAEIAHCDDCMTTARPWQRGRAVFAYKGTGRALVLRLKHSDRTDIVPAAARWMARAVDPILAESALFVPVPLHWRRLLGRRYNQAALLAQAVAANLGRDVCVDALVRHRFTKPLEHHSRADRFAAMDGVIRPHISRGAQMRDRHIVLVDDVMTSGATLAACADACLGAGAQQVCVVTLARVVKDA